MNDEVFLYPTHEELLQDLEIAGRPLKDLIGEVQRLYRADNRPWIIGFSGGKDSTAVLSLIYAALTQLPAEQRHKHIYVVSSDTLVETPVVVDQIKSVLDTINQTAEEAELPVSAHPVYPETDRTFWANLLGRGYPAPSNRFRWCTERMKIDPVSQFITERVMEFGEVIVVLGSRSQESATRAQVIAKHKIDGSSLARHTSLPNAFTYMPIEEWSADDVWEYLMSAPCPWGGSNRTLFELYKGSNQGECPLVIDKSTPSCGNSRFGCWTCTVVTEDKALHGLIESGADWMRPLLEFRNKLYDSARGENSDTYRNYKRRTGRVTFDSKDTEATERKLIRGPYWMKYRQEWLRDLLLIEKEINEGGNEIELITRDELQVIRQQWLKDPNEPDWKDSLPRIFAEVYPDEEIEWIENDAGAFTEPDAELLAELEKEFDVPSELIIRLMEVQLSQSSLSRRRGVVADLEKILKQDWEDFEEIEGRMKETQAKLKERLDANSYDEKLQELQVRYDAIEA